MRTPRVRCGGSTRKNQPGEQRERFALAQEQRQLELSYSSGSPSEHCSRSRRCCCPPGSWVLKDVFSEGSRVEALTAAPVPANKPANAAPASMAFVVFRHFNVSRQIYNEMRNT